MAYQSVHSGPAIDAAVTQLADIQIVRDESNANLATVQTLAGQAATSANTASTAAASATTALSNATATIAAADHTRQEQINAEIAIVADQRFAAEQAATEAVAAAAAAVVTVTQDMAASVPTPNKLPLADAQGKIASDWLGADIARGDALSAADGAEMVGFQQSGAGAVARTLQDKVRDVVSVRDFGAVGDGVADDTAAIQAAIDAVSGAGGGTVVFHGRHLIDGDLYVRDRVRLQGPLGQPGEMLPASSADYDSGLGTLVVSSSSTVTVMDSSSVSGAVVIRKGLDLPFANAAQAATGLLAFAGTAFTVGGADALFENLLILGFDKAILSVGFERVRCEYVSGDCNNGIDIQKCWDISYLNNCHFWPWTTTHNSWTFSPVEPGFPQPGQLLTRPGNAYRFKDGGDWNKASDCFSYGYERGFVIDGASDCTLTSCGTDYYGPIAGTSVGIQVIGSSKNTTLIACQTAAQSIGVDFDSSSETNRTIKLIGCSAWGNEVGFRFRTGNSSVVGCAFDQPAGSVRLDSGSSGLLTGCVFAGAGGINDLSGGGWRKHSNHSSTGANQLGVGVNALVGETYTDARFRAPVMESRTESGVAVYEFRREGAPADQKAWRWSMGATNSLALLTLKDNDTAGDTVFQAVRGAGASVVELIFGAAGATRISIDGSALRSRADATYNLGTAAFRWSNVYASTGTINTSDERAKQQVRDLSTAERAVAARLKSLIRAFKFNDAVAAKGENARTHFGVIAQDVKAAFEAEGLVAEDYAILCYDEWDEQPETADEDGNVTQEYRPAGSRYGVRYEELLAFIIGAL